jgi:hypothetical protein
MFNTLFEEVNTIEPEMITEDDSDDAIQEALGE